MLSMCKVRIVFLLWIKLHNLSPEDVCAFAQTFIKKKSCFHFCHPPVFGYDRSLSEMLNTTISIVTL